MLAKLLNPDRRRSGRRDEDANTPTLTSIEVEMRRARRFALPFAVLHIDLSATKVAVSMSEIARVLRGELREFDYLVVDGRHSQITIWSFGTPRDGAIVLKGRLQTTSTIADFLSDAPIGMAVFPDDALTTEALLSVARYNCEEVRETQRLSVVTPNQPSYG